MSNPNQSLDQFSDQKVSVEMEKELGRRGYQQFLEATPDYFHCPQNVQAIVNWLNEHNVPCSLRNCGVAYQELQGELETGIPDVTYTPSQDRGITRVDARPVLRYDTEAVAETSLLREDRKRLGKDLAIGVVEKRLAENAENYSLSEIGKPVSKELKTKFYQSLGANQRSASTGMTQGEARARIASEYPDMDVRTIEFSRLVAKVLRDNQ